MDNWIFEQIKAQGNNTAIIVNNSSHSYLELYNSIENFYKKISKEIPKGSIVAILSDYSFISITLFFALYHNNNIIVPITSSVNSEVNDKLSVANCEYTININNDNNIQINKRASSENHSLIKSIQKINQSGLILFSSGSTGKPKAMIHNLNSLIDSFKNKKSKKLVFMIFLMFDHIGGLNTMLNCISMGITMIFPTTRNPDEICSLIEKFKVNILPASPTFLNLILISESYQKYDLSSLKMITYGTEPMPESLLLKIKKAFPSVKLLQTFGTSETGISSASSKSSDSTFIKLDDTNTEYKIVNSELWLRSKTQILGYLNSSMESFTEDGWFKTGDIVEQSEDGYINIIGRSKEMINIGGEKVLPTEVESILLLMPEVKDCIVYGEKNPIMGQMVVAKVLFNIEIRPSEAKKLITTFCINKLARYKIPSKVLIMAESEYSERFKKKRI